MNSSNDIRVSFLVSTYNRAYCVERCIKNLLDNTLQNIEVLVRDNGSFDETPVVLDKIEDSRFKYWRSHCNGGTASFLKIANYAKGEVITWLSDEDDFNFDQLDFILSVFDKNPQCHVVMGSHITGKSSVKISYKDEFIRNPILSNLEVLRFSGLAGVFIRRNIFFESFSKLNITTAEQAYDRWNYYPIGHFAMLSCNSTIYKTSKIVAIQSRFAKTTNNWSFGGKKSILLPHYFPESIYDRIRTDIYHILKKQMSLIAKTKLVLYRFLDFKRQIENCDHQDFILLLKENYTGETVKKYIQHLNEKRLSSFLGKKFYVVSRFFLIFFKILKC